MRSGDVFHGHTAGRARCDLIGADRPAAWASSASFRNLAAYYAWLSDLQETGLGKLDMLLVAAPRLRECFKLSEDDAGELYANTDLDSLILSKCCEQFLAERTPLSLKALEKLHDAEFNLAARAGVLRQLLAQKNA